ncbi:MAG: hypothetical protein ABIK64_05105, partial [Bacillota bacterium]
MAVANAGAGKKRAHSKTSAAVLENFRIILRIIARSLPKKYTLWNGLLQVCYKNGKEKACRFTIHIGQQEKREEKDKAKSVIAELHHTLAERS